MLARTLLSLSFVAIAATVAHAATVSYDANTQTFLDWSVTNSMSGSFGGFSETPVKGSSTADAGGCAVDFGNAPRLLCVNPSSALVAGAKPDLLSSSLDSYVGSLQVFASGPLQDPPQAPPPGGGDAVPEPATFALVALALAGVAELSRLRRPLIRRLT